MPTAAKKNESPRCTIRKFGCAVHGFIHGSEAEELREGIEKIVRHYSDASFDNDADLMLEELRRLLEEVDARDSVAFLEAKTRRQRRAVKRSR